MQNIKDYNRYLEKLVIENLSKLDNIRFILNKSFFNRLKFFISKKYRNELYSNSIQNKDSFMFFEKDKDKDIVKIKTDTYDNIISDYNFIKVSSNTLVLEKRGNLKREGWL